MSYVPRCFKINFYLMIQYISECVARISVVTHSLKNIEIENILEYNNI